MTHWTRILTALVVGIALTLALVVGGRWLPTSAASRTGAGGLLGEVLDRVAEDYVDPVDQSALLEAAVRGLVSDLDAHSQFLDEGEFDAIRQGASGAFSGIGLDVTLMGRDVVVITALAGSPAQRAGLQHGDLVLAIDDWPVDSSELLDTVSRLRGPAGTRIRLDVLRAEQTLRFDLMREQLTRQSVAYHGLGQRIGYLQISQFHERTEAQVRAALNQLRASGDDAALVLDLRNNPGGVLDSAVDVADLFVDHGLIVSARGRTATARFAHPASEQALWPGVPMVVLVNGASASGAEIVAGALQDHARATLIGTSTFGKGLVQSVLPLSDGQAIKLTTSRYFTPNGDDIQDRGITPDIVVRPQAGDQDQQLSYALNWLLQQTGTGER